MIKLIFIIIINILLIKNLFAYESIYQSEYIDINIEEINISEAKILEIEKAKNQSLLNILKNILDNESLMTLKRNVQIKKKINNLIKNINIENEFIIENKYSAKIKINFDKNEIIKLLRNNKINYTDLESSDLLLVALKKNALNVEGLSNNNNFYSKFNIKKLGLLNFQYPDLSNNDRYILPVNKISELDLISLKNISKKYETNYVIIIKIDNFNQLNSIKISIYSNIEKLIIENFEIEISDKDDYHYYLIEIIDNWWKKKNIINHSLINQEKCSIKSTNMYELNYILDRINSVSQIKSVELKEIKYQSNIYQIIYYGDLKNLDIKFSNFNIVKKNTNNNKCILFVDN